jgi:hypothetical protein
MRTRNHDLLDTKTGNKMLGIQLSKDGKRWWSAHIGNEPFFADDEEDRKKMREYFRKLPINPPVVGHVRSSQGA